MCLDGTKRTVTLWLLNKVSWLTVPIKRAMKDKYWGQILSSSQKPRSIFWCESQPITYAIQREKSLSLAPLNCTVLLTNHLQIIQTCSWILFYDTLFSQRNRNLKVTRLYWFLSFPSTYAFHLVSFCHFSISSYNHIRLQMGGRSRHPRGEPRSSLLGKLP